MTAHVVAVAHGQKLTARELSIVANVAHGWTNAQIGTRLGITESTVRTYVKRIYVKTAARNRAHLVTIAFVRGYISLPTDGIEETP